ncbi:glycosyltransferase family protein [Butyrivibrio fibrisolvens]|uniref:glycosyltransferase family protein n=1 Tax=Butyrivibrio fibrisolvens TaxID=831 RepID=UPI000429FFE9|nr:glycosyltransferase family protein [Butyrivibrio fibrisolvens]
MASNRKIAFIICTNNKIQFDECKLYIDKLIVPDGYETELIPIYGAVSMTSGYNSAMAETDARYKIYMHQDVYIINKYFLLNIIDIFNKDDSIGMIGMIGSIHIPPSAVMWLGMIEKGDVSGAFVALSLIPDPSVETRQLLDEFRKA